MKEVVIILCFCFPIAQGIAQEKENNGDENWHLYRASSDSADTTHSRTDSLDLDPDFEANTDSSDFFDPTSYLAYGSSKPGTVTVIKDGRIDEILTFLGTPNPPNPVQIEGYRVQLFFDKDRNRVLGEKARFLTNFPEYEAYMEWNAPFHNLRVGDFHTQQRANRICEELKLTFPSATVVNSKINLPKLEVKYPEEEEG